MALDNSLVATPTDIYRYYENVKSFAKLVRFCTIKRAVSLFFKNVLKTEPGETPLFRPPLASGGAHWT